MSRRLHPHENFWPKADVRGPDDCWVWKGERNQYGYGCVSRMRDRRRVRIRATHIAWEYATEQPWPPEAIALHSCDNPSCVNPAHIRPGTHAENMADKTARGRHANGRPPCGHPRLDDLIQRDGQRRCRECKRQYDRAHRDQKIAYSRQRRAAGRHP